MFTRLSGRALVVALGVAVATSAGVVAVPPAYAAAAPDRTSEAEARRVDRVMLTLNWFDCTSLTADGSPADCTTAAVPLDYDDPSGPTVDLAVLRLKATDRANRIGTLFVNPGGPGGSGVLQAAEASKYFDPKLLARFDIVGVDPRGTNFSTNLRCWHDATEQQQAVGALVSTAFPVTDAERRTWVAESKAYGKACASTGAPLAAAMSTAEVARDFDVLRRTLGDDKLSFLGLSYGTYLGNVYAQLFPDRVRAVVLDGVIDPLAWAGTADTRNVPQTARLRSGEGGYAAFLDLLGRCAEAKAPRCKFAAKGDPVATFRSLAASLRATPVYDPALGGTLDYQTFVALLVRDLYDANADTLIDTDLTRVWDLLHGDAAASHAAAAAVGARLAEMRAATDPPRSFRARVADLARTSPGGGWAADQPYDTRPDALLGVMCSDGTGPAEADAWPAYVDASQKGTEGFGERWTWMSSPCASSTWTASDEDAYRGPFTHRTAAPVLVVGGRHDPATNYEGAVAVSRQLPGSRLVTNDGLGHGAYGTDTCITDVIDGYLLTGALPAEGTVCAGSHVPFAPASGSTTPQAKRATGGLPLVWG